MTEKIKFCYFNFVDQPATNIIPSSENTLFLASNLKDKFSTNRWRSTTSTANVVFDFKTTEEVNTIIIRGSLIDGFGFNGVLTIEANATNEWSSPAFTTIIAAGNDFNFKHLTLPTSESYRFWRISGSGAQYLELSNVFIGAHFQPERNISKQFSFDNKDLSRRQRNKFNQSYEDRTSDQQILSGKINLLTQANIDDYFQFINYVGTTKPFFLIFDESEFVINDSERMSGVYQFRTRPKVKHVIKGIYNTDLKMEESP